MKTLKQLLTLPRQAGSLLQTSRIPKWSLVLFVVIATVGFSDATFLTIEHFRETIPPCLASGCEAVLTSVYSTVFGIPVSLLGALFYLFLLVLLFAYYDLNGPKSEKALRLALFTTFFGLLASIYFVSLQVFILHSYCQYCLLSAVTSTSLFIIAFVLVKKYNE